MGSALNYIEFKNFNLSLTKALKRCSTTDVKNRDSEQTPIEQSLNYYLCFHIHPYLYLVDLTFHNTQ